MIRVAMLIPDNRDEFGRFDEPEPFFGPAPTALLEGLQRCPDCEVHVVSCSRVQLPAPSHLAGNIHYHGVPVRAFGRIRYAYAGRLRAVRRCIAKLQPDIVHGQGAERECALSAAYSGRPNVVTIHGNMAELHRLGYLGRGGFGPLAARFETHALKRSAGVFCNSEHTRRLVAPRARRTWLVPNAIRRAFFDTPRSHRAAGGDVPQVVNVGVIAPYKQPLELLRAIGALVRTGRKCRIVFAGRLPEDTEYRRAFSEELRIARAKGYGEHAGHLGTDAMIALLDQSDACIHVPKEEAFGLVAAEALARGLKLFGSRVGGLRDIAANVDGAELHDDVDSLSASLAAWIEAGCSMPTRAADQMAERYHPDVIARRHMEIYREVLCDR